VSTRQLPVQSGVPTDCQSRVWPLLLQRRFSLALQWWCEVDYPSRGRVPGRCGKCPRVGFPVSESRLCSCLAVHHNTRLRRCISYTKCADSPCNVRCMVTAKTQYNLKNAGESFREHQAVGAQGRRAAGGGQMDSVGRGGCGQARRCVDRKTKPKVARNNLATLGGSSTAIQDWQLVEGALWEQLFTQSLDALNISA
jgi:hypothetical protein